MRIVDENRNSKHINLSWQQYYNNLEIVNSRLYAKLTFNNELIVFGLDIHNDINISVSATIDQTAAIAAASENLHHEITSSRVEQELKVLPIPMNKKYEYHLVYVVHIETRISAGPQLGTFLILVNPRSEQYPTVKNKRSPHQVREMRTLIL